MICVTKPMTNVDEVFGRGIKVSTQAFACMLGGSEGKTLFVCTAGSSNPTDCAKNKDGRIEAFSVRVEGAGLP